MAEFVGDADEELMTDGDVEKACRRQVQFSIWPSRQEFTAPGEGWSDKIQLHFPSDPENAFETMLRLQAEYGIIVSNGSYQAFFRYAAFPLEGRDKGDPGAVHYLARIPEGEDYIRTAFSQVTSDEPVQLNKDGGFSFKIESAEKFRPVDMALEFLASDVVVAAITITLITPVF